MITVLHILRYHALSTTFCLLMILSAFSVSFAVNAAGVSSCQYEVAAFLSAPTKQTLFALARADDSTCWLAIGSSNEKLNQLLRFVKRGNQWSARYLAKHLGRLDGGNLEDSLIALGLFGDYETDRLLALSKDEDLSDQELRDALTMLPLSLSDNPEGQLKMMKERRNRVERVSRSDLADKKALALKDIDDFLAEIESRK